MAAQTRASETENPDKIAHSISHGNNLLCSCVEMLAIGLFGALVVVVCALSTQLPGFKIAFTEPPRRDPIDAVSRPPVSRLGLVSRRSI